MKRIVTRDRFAKVIPESAKQPAGRNIGDLVLVAFRTVTPAHVDPYVMVSPPPRPNIEYEPEFAGIIREGEWDLVNCVNIPVSQAIQKSARGWVEYDYKKNFVNLSEEDLRIGGYIGDHTEAIVAVGQPSIESYFLLGGERFFEKPETSIHHDSIPSFFRSGVEACAEFYEQFGIEPTERIKTADHEIKIKRAKGLARTDWGKLRNDQIGHIIHELEEIERKYPDINITPKLNISEYVNKLKETRTIGVDYIGLLGTLGEIRKEISAQNE